MSSLANKLTVLRIILAPVIVIVAALGFEGWPLMAGLVFAVASVSDFADGQIARHYNQVSDFGKLVDPIADKLLTSCAMIVLIAWGKLPSWVAIVLVTRDVIVSAMRIVAAEHHLVVSARMSGKIKTVFQLCAYGSYFFGWNGLGHVLLWLGVITTVWSLVDYLYANKHVLQRHLLPAFILSFSGQLLSMVLVFVLVGTKSLNILMAMVIMGKDTIISGIKAMASANGRPMPTSMVERGCYALTFFYLALLVLTNVESSSLNWALCLAVALAAIGCCLQVVAQSKPKSIRVK